MKQAKWKPKISACWISQYTIGFGVWLYCCFDPSYTAPIGLVWGIPLGERFEVFHSYTILPARRCGVRAAINREIFRHFRTISSSDTASTKAGTAFMKSQGYRRFPQLNVWAKQRPDVEKPKNKKRCP
jgi:hypothetical protein